MFQHRFLNDRDFHLKGFQQKDLRCSLLFEKHYFDQSYINFLEINVDIDFKKKKEMILKSGGKTSVPQIFYENQHIGGCDDLIKIDKKDGLQCVT